VGQAFLPAAVWQSPNLHDVRQPAWIARRIHHPCYNLPQREGSMPDHGSEKINGMGYIHCAGVKA
jgi:hypothetical protein